MARAERFPQICGNLNAKVIHRPLQPLPPAPRGLVGNRPCGNLGDLPLGRIIVVTSDLTHVCAVIDRVIYDLSDCSQRGRTTLAGFWARPKTAYSDCARSGPTSRRPRGSWYR